jgi:hypothetical protein
VEVQPSLECLEERLVPSTTGVISSNFNGTAIGAGDFIWFNSVAKVSGVPSTGATIHVTDESVTYTVKGATTTLQLPSADVSFSPTASQASTNFDSTTNTWETVVPLNPGGNVFLGGGGVQFPQGLPGGANPVNWSADFSTDTAGVSLKWQWAAAVYTSFSSDPSALGVKPVDSNNLSQYHNSDHAGTPENYTIPGILPGGARGGGGSNWTGSYSGTASMTPDVSTTNNQLATLSGNVAGLNGAIATLVLLDSNNNVVQTTMTDGNGDYNFFGVQAGTYTITQEPPALFIPAGPSSPGTVAGKTDGNPDSAGISITGIVVVGGNKGINYDFFDTMIVG